MINYFHAIISKINNAWTKKVIQQKVVVGKMVLL